MNNNNNDQHNNYDQRQPATTNHSDPQMSHNERQLVKISCNEAQ